MIEKESARELHPPDGEPRTEPERATLSPEHRKALTQVAREAIDAFLTTGAVPQFTTDDSTLLQPRATFVTLRRRGSGELRGCCGEWMARLPLIESVAHTAIASATDDPRFYPVTADELPDLCIEISVLTPLQPLRAADVEVGRHGLLIRKGHRRGLLLPQAPRRYGWDRDEFLAALCRKVGLPPQAWRASDVELYGFEAEHWTEEDFLTRTAPHDE